VVYVSISLSPALVVSTNIPPYSLLYVSEVSTSGNSIVAVTSDLSMQLEGTWTTIDYSNSTLRGDKTTGILLRVSATARAIGLSEGYQLLGASFTFTVPEKWSDGSSIALNQTLPLQRFGWGVTLSGDTRAELSPIQLSGE